MWFDSHKKKIEPHVVIRRIDDITSLNTELNTIFNARSGTYVDSKMQLLQNNEHWYIVVFLLFSRDNDDARAN